VVVVGAAVLRMRVRTGGWHGHAGAGLQVDATRHEHHHPHHSHPHNHHHDHEDAITKKGILGVGMAAGLLPCPSALVVLLSAIALHRVGFGLALIVAFSLGLAATITAIGLVAVMARRAFSRVSLEGRLVRALPALSALVILGVGLLLTARAIPEVL
jgi:ABC-type nickel/cobalt efflux system permease component RcnA